MSLCRQHFSFFTPCFSLVWSFCRQIHQFNTHRMLECAVPPQRESRAVQVCVSANGYLKLNDSQCTTFSYDVPLTVKYAYPLSGPSSGNSVVTINGGSFRNSIDLYCESGSSVISATYVTSIQIKCIGICQHDHFVLLIWQAASPSLFLDSDFNFMI
jgi:hypothetical protein